MYLSIEFFFFTFIRKRFISNNAIFTHFRLVSEILPFEKFSFFLGNQNEEV